MLKLKDFILKCNLMLGKRVGYDTFSLEKRVKFDTFSLEKRDKFSLSERDHDVYSCSYPAYLVIIA